MKSLALCFVVNPHSGSAGESGALEEKIRARFPDARIVESRVPGDAMRLAAEAVRAGATGVVAAGGDGTLNEVLNGLMEAGNGAVLGLLPLGTGNDFARSFGVPAEMDAALEAIATGAVRRLDVVRASGAATRYFLNASAGGFSGIMNEKMTPEIKAAWGPLSYLRGMIEALQELQPYAATIVADKAPPLELSVLNVVVANARYVARGVPIAPAADPTDGLLDLVAIRDATAARLTLLTPLVLTGTHLGSEEVLHLRARRFEVSSVPPMTFNADGEMLGEGAFRYEVLGGEVRFLSATPEGKAPPG